jgi:hypothetical protein
MSCHQNETVNLQILALDIIALWSSEQLQPFLSLRMMQLASLRED